MREKHYFQTNDKEEKKRREKPQLQHHKKINPGIARGGNGIDAMPKMPLKTQDERLTPSFFQ